MASSPSHIRLLLLILPVLIPACSSPGTAGRPTTAPAGPPPSQLEIQSTIMSLSDELIFSVADACDRVERRTDRPAARVACAEERLGTAVGALAAATSRNAAVGLVDLLTLTTLQRMSLESPWAFETFDEPDRLLLRDTFARAERNVRAYATQIHTPRHLDELDAMIRTWRADHPDQVSVYFVRLQEFAADRQTSPAAPRERRGGPVILPTSSILRLLGVDPLAQLDPATRQIQETRLLAERLSFWAQRLPLVLGWQTELTAARLAASPPARNLLQNASQVSAATTQASDAAARVATSYDRMLNELPGERRAAIEQIDRVAATQASALVDRTAAALTAERTAAIDQVGRQLNDTVDRLNRAVDAQRAQSLDQTARLLAAERRQISTELTAHLAAVDAASQRLIDRAAKRLLLVVVLGALAVACIAYAYRRLTARLGKP